MKVALLLGLLFFGVTNTNVLMDYWKGADRALIREMRLVAKQNPRKYQENQDAVVLKHIPLDTSAEIAMETCQKSGFGTYQRKTLEKGEIYPGFEEVIGCTKQETRWNLIFSDEYQVFAYLKNDQVGAVSGRAFQRLFGSI
jgi:hypothetical protein